jgi:hypothetical protein
MRVPRVNAALGALAILAALALTAPRPARADDADPPGRVARLSYLEGAVSLEPAGLADWAPAERNRPLTSGDRLWTDQESVAELDLGDAVLRLGGMTGFAFLNLDDRFAQIQLSAGLLIVRVWDTSAGQTYEIDTPNLALSLQQPGVYRIEVDEPGDTTLVKVSEGEALALGSGESIPIPAQQLMVFSGSTTLSYSAASLGPPDDLDTWSANRDRQEEESPSRQYVADDTPGSADLDDNGRWQSTPDYGYVWTPAVVVAGWVPYRFGHWLWVAPWGWTWVDDAPWGYATFHYGRWALLNGSWCWVPGPRSLRPAYAPALVGWTHGPGSATPGAPLANVGWFPLAPHEVYAPAYPASEMYLRNVNLANTTVANSGTISDIYHNRVAGIRYRNGTAGAITQVPPGVFTSSQRVVGHTLPVTTSTLAGMTVAAAAPAIPPARQSVLGAPGRRAGRPPPALANRPVVVRAAPPRAPASFDAQLAAIQANAGRPLARAELARLPAGTPVAQVHLLAPTTPASQASLAARAHALQTPTLPPATTTRTFVHDPSPPNVASPGVSTPTHTDRPASASQRPSQPNDPSRANARPPVTENSRPATASGSSPPPAAPQTRTPRASPSAPPPVPPQHPGSATTKTQSSHKDSHEESGPKADRSHDRGEH